MEGDEREKPRAYVEHSLRPQPPHEPVVAWRCRGDHPETRETGKLNCKVTNRGAPPVYENLHQKGVITKSAVFKRTPDGVATEGLPKVGSAPGPGIGRGLAV